jgi:hypothetical protein
VEKKIYPQNFQLKILKSAKSLVFSRLLGCGHIFQQILKKGALSKIAYTTFHSLLRHFDTVWNGFKIGFSTGG